MTSDNLENLASIGRLKKEPPREDELKGLKQSALSRLADAERPNLTFDSRFDLAYNAAHALALYALRRSGYRSDNRALVFQALPDTAGLSTGHWRTLANAHAKRNRMEYEGVMEQDKRLLADVIRSARALIEVLGLNEGR